MNRYENVGFNPVNCRLSTFDPLKGYKMEACSPVVETIAEKVREDEENFIFEVIGPFCSEVAQRKISKKDLKDAIRFWMDNGCPRA